MIPCNTPVSEISELILKWWLWCDLFKNHWWWSWTLSGVCQGKAVGVIITSQWDWDCYYMSSLASQWVQLWIKWLKAHHAVLQTPLCAEIRQREVILNTEPIAYISKEITDISKIYPVYLYTHLLMSLETWGTCLTCEPAGVGWLLIDSLHHGWAHRNGWCTVIDQVVVGM